MRVSWTVLLVALALVGCADEEPPRASVEVQDAIGPLRDRVATRTPPPDSPLHSLIDALGDADLDSPAGRDAIDALVAIGPPAARALLDLPSDARVWEEGDPSPAEVVLHALGPAALGPMAAELRSGRSRHARDLISLVCDALPTLRTGPELDAAAAALLRFLELDLTRQGGPALHGVHHWRIVWAVGRMVERGRLDAEPPTRRIEAVLEHQLRATAGDDRRMHVSSIVESLNAWGHAAAPLIPTVQRAWDAGAVESSDSVIGLLRATGPLRPEIVEWLEPKLSDPDPDHRLLAAASLRHAELVRPSTRDALVEALEDTSAPVRIAAAAALVQSVDVPIEQRRAAIAVLCRAHAGAAFSDVTVATTALSRLRDTAEGAELLRQELRSLHPQIALPLLRNGLAHQSGDAEWAFRLFRHSDDVAVRRAAVDLLPADPPSGTTLDALRELLADEDDGVRRRAAEHLFIAQAEPDPRVVETLTRAARRTDEVGETSRFLLASAAEIDSSTRDLLRRKYALCRSLGAGGTIHASVSMVEQLSRQTGPLGALPPHALDALAASVFDGWTDRQALQLLARFDGGTDALLRAFAGGLRDRTIDSELVIDGLVVLGRRALPLREDALAAAYEPGTADGGRSADAVRLFFAGLEGDLDRLALEGPPETLWTLLDHGVTGRRALLLLGGSNGFLRSSVLNAVPEDDDALDAAAVAAVVGESEDPHLERRQRGAATVARRFDPDTAERVLRALSDCAVPLTRSLAFNAYAIACERHGRAPAQDLVLAGLVDAAGHWAVMHLCEHFELGSVAVRDALAAAIEDADPAVRVSIARAWLDRGGDVERAATIVRESIRAYRSLRPEDRSHGNASERVRPDPFADAWSGKDAARVLLAARPVADNAALVRDYERVRELWTMVDVLPPLGRDALPALPVLRAQLDTVARQDDLRRMGSASLLATEHSALRTLTAMGPAAAPAEPQIRTWIARTGDPEGLGEKALRAVRGE